MAFKFNRSSKEPMSEINVTPFVDVMLVLLIIFMVTAPLLTVGVQVDLPESSADSLPEETEPLTLSINAKGEIFIQEAKVDDPMAVVFQDAMENLLKKKSKNNLSERMPTFLEVGIEKQMSKKDKGFTFLATVGSTAPFIGLFGTVWGIMNSFQSIAISRNTSLAIVAPGIAEALFATALGLLAAIPAVVAYNKFNTDLQKYSQKLENFSKRFLTIV